MNTYNPPVYREGMWDSIKGIAMIGIILVHLGTTNHLDFNSEAIRSIYRNGLLGVEITFIVSAYFYCRGLHNKNNLSIKQCYNYVLHKILRIVPEYFFIITLNYYILYIRTGIHIEIGNVVSHYLFVNMLIPKWYNDFFGGSWYVSALVLSYIFFAPLVRKINNFGDSTLKCILCILCSYIVFNMIGNCTDRFFGKWSEPYNSFLWCWNRTICCFAIGIFLFFFFDEYRSKIKTETYMKWLLTVLGWGGVFVGCIRYETFDSILFSLIISIIIIVNINEPVVIISNPVFSLIGRYSFEIYLLHDFVFVLITQEFLLIKPGIKCFFVTMLLTSFLSILLQKLIQKPFDRLIKRLKDKTNHL